MLNIQAKLTLSAILALGFIGCGSGGNTPKDAAVVFLEKKYNGDLNSSIEYDWMILLLYVEWTYLCCATYKLALSYE